MTYQLPEATYMIGGLRGEWSGFYSCRGDQLAHIAACARDPDASSWYEWLYTDVQVLAAYEAGRASRGEEVRDLKLEIEETRKVVKEIRQYATLRAAS